MKKQFQFLVVLTIMLLSLQSAYSQNTVAQVNFTFSENEYETSTGWSNIPGGSNGSYISLGNGISIRPNEGLSGGTSGDSTGSTFPNIVAKNYHFINDDNTYTYDVQDLDNTKTYTFEFFASREFNGTTTNRTTWYAVGGSSEVSLNADGNTDNTVEVTGVVPATGGSTQITIRKDVAAAYGYISALLIHEEVTGPVAVTGISLDQTTASLPRGETLTLNETVSPSDASDKSVSWSSSNTAVATVVDGVVTGESVGNATITVTTNDGAYEATCAVTVTPVAATGISLDRTTATIGLGFATTLVASVSPSNASNQGVSWSSSNTNIATVSATGRVQGIAVGSATITATTNDGGFEATCDVTVRTYEVTLITINPMGFGLYVGETRSFNASVVPNFATDKTITWSCEACTDGNGNPYISINPSTGMITAHRVTPTGGQPPTAVATDASGTVEGRGYVSVGAHQPVTSVSLNTGSAYLSVNQTQQLTATVNPSNASNTNVSWSTGDASVATVNQNGVVTGVNVGATTITVSTEEGGYTSECDVTVTGVAVQRISLTKLGMSLELNQTGSFEAVVSPPNATDKTITWECENCLDENNQPYISIDPSTGVITAHQVTPRVGVPPRAVAKDASGTVASTYGFVSVVPPTAVASVALNINDADLVIDETFQLSAAVSPDHAANKNISWESSDEGIAEVDDSGLVRARGSGTATITVTTEDGDHTAECVVHVFSQATTPFTSISIEPDGYTLYNIGDTKQLSAIMLPEETCTDCKGRTTTWYSFNPGVVSVDENGLITATGYGHTTITTTGSPASGPTTYGITVHVIKTTETEFEGNIRLVPDAENTIDRFDVIFGAKNKEKGRIWTPKEGGLNLASKGFNPHLRIETNGSVRIPKLAGPVDLSSDLSIKNGDLTVGGDLLVDKHLTFNKGITVNNTIGTAAILTCLSTSTSTTAPPVTTLDFQMVNASDNGFIAFDYDKKMIFSHDFAHIPLQLNADGTVVINNWMDNWGVLEQQGDINNGHALLVNGTIGCEGVSIVSDAIQSDFVFEEDYDLRSLSEVENYVKEHKHLPEIPAATDFHDGYRVDVMHDLLLRKVEELTLYIIELQKQMKSMQEELGE